MTLGSWRRGAAALLAVLFSTAALGCPPEASERCLVGVCACVPGAGPERAQSIGVLKDAFFDHAGGRILERWIMASRNIDIGHAKPIPPQIRSALAGYVDQSLMNHAWFTVGARGSLNLAGLTFQYGDRVYGRNIAAVTLNDLIVFRNAKDAYQNAALWAHELTHIRQYRDWGAQGFALRYAHDPDSVEGPAFAVVEDYRKWIASGRVTTAGGAQSARR